MHNEKCEIMVINFSCYWEYKGIRFKRNERKLADRQRIQYTQKQIILRLSYH